MSIIILIVIAVISVITISGVIAFVVIKNRGNDDTGNGCTDNIDCRCLWW